MNPVGSKMKTELTKNLACFLDIIMVLVAMSLFACNHGDVSSSLSFTPDYYGMPLHGGYRFDCGDGELSALVSPEGVEVVPPGAVLSVVRTGYCIGYYDRGAFFFRDGQRISLDKVFFAVQSNGELDFYEESKERTGFFGAKIAEPVQFERGAKRQQEP